MTLFSGPNLHRLVCVCVLALAAFLRLHELPAEILRLDEAVAVKLAKGTVGEVVSNTGWFGSSPILYPLMLAGVQLVDDSPTAVRLLPAIASILTVAALLFWLPRVGIAPGAALLAGLMATLSGELIQHAQDVREYSIDALVATLMLIGLLKYLRSGGRALLCATLAIAPLVQYGLVLFGAAVLATLALAPRCPRRLDGGLRGRLVCLTDATACFALSAGATHALTLHIQGGLDAATTGDHGSMLKAGIFRGDLADLGAVFQFVGTQPLAFAGHFAPSGVAVVGGLALAALTVRSITTRRALAPVPMLFLFAGAMASAAALLSFYPLWGHRHCIYLTPILFVGLAHAVYAVLEPRFPRQALVGVAAVAVLAEGGAAVAADFPYHERGEAEVMLATLEAHVGDDPLYLSNTVLPVMDYYRPRLERQVFRGHSCKWAEDEQCAQDFVIELLNMHRDGTQRVWVAFHWHAWPIIEQWGHERLARYIGPIGMLKLWFIPDPAAVLSPLLQTTEQLTAFVSTLADDSHLVVEHTDFNVYTHAGERALIYVAGDAAVDDLSILLHVAPAVKQCQPVDILDFRFRGPFRLNGRPAQVVFLPDYPLGWVSTGRMADDHVVELWRRGFGPELESALPAGQSAIDSEPCRHRPESATEAVMRLARMANAKPGT